MNLWKEIDCPNYISINNQIKIWIEQQEWIYTTTKFWNPIGLKHFFSSCPDFYQWTVESKLLLRSLAVTVAHNKSSCPLHIDTPPARYKLSWPVKNTAGSWNRWFNNLTEQTDGIINHLGGINFVSDTNLVEIARREVLLPSLIDAGIPHEVWFDDSAIFPRIGIQCQLLKEPKQL